jgi:divalent metal cation (Fe/Co/Zn/Cd) transporter
LERAEDLAGIGIAVVIWASAAFAGFESIRKLIRVVHRLADGIDPEVITKAEAAAGSVPGVIHAHARARWTGRTLRVEIEGWVDPDVPAKEADAMGRLVASKLSHELPEARSLTWTTRAAPA